MAILSRQVIDCPKCKTTIIVWGAKGTAGKCPKCGTQVRTNPTTKTRYMPDYGRHYKGTTSTAKKICIECGETKGQFVPVYWHDKPASLCMKCYYRPVPGMMPSMVNPHRGPYREVWEGARVRMKPGRGGYVDEFTGKTGTVIGIEGEFLRIKLDEPVKVRGLDRPVTDDIWMPHTVTKIRTKRNPGFQYHKGQYEYYDKESKGLDPYSDLSIKLKTKALLERENALNTDIEKMPNPSKRWHEDRISTLKMKIPNEQDHYQQSRLVGALVEENTAMGHYKNPIQNVRSRVMDTATLNGILKQLATLKGMNINRDTTAGTVTVTGVKTGRVFLNALKVHGGWIVRFDSMLIQERPNRAHPLGSK